MVVINDRTREAFKEINRLTVGGMTEFVETVVELAKQPPPRGAPRDTGNLSDSIASDDPGELSFRIFTQTGYGAYPELGTSRMAAQPYLAPAIDGGIREFNRGGKWS